MGTHNSCTTLHRQLTDFTVRVNVNYPSQRRHKYKLQWVYHVSNSYLAVRSPSLLLVRNPSLPSRMCSAVNYRSVPNPVWHLPVSLVMASAWITTTTGAAITSASI